MIPNRGYTIADKERDQQIGPTIAHVRQEVRVYDADAKTWRGTGKYEMATAKVSDVLK